MYFSPDIGQHVAIYSKGALQEIAKKYNCQVYSAQNKLHLLTKRKFAWNPLTYPVYSTLIGDKILGRNFMNRQPLLKTDYAKVKNLLLEDRKKQ